VNRLLLPSSNNNDQDGSHSIQLIKGLWTAEKLLRRLDDLSLPRDVLTLDAMSELTESLFKISVYATHEPARKQSSALLKLLFAKLDRPARFDFINIFANQHGSNNNNDTGNIYIQSFLIYLFKEEVNECISCNDSFYCSTSSNNNFKTLCGVNLRLGNGDETDLVQESSKLVAGLNLIRFVLLRDKLNVTGVREVVRALPFLGHLERAVRVSKAHYELEKRNIHNKQPSEINNNSISGINVSLSGGKELRQPSSKEQLGAVEAGLQSIDLIECLRIRVFEILEQCERV
jgi:hypothetical protein